MELLDKFRAGAARTWPSHRRVRRTAGHRHPAGPGRGDHRRIPAARPRDVVGGAARRRLLAARRPDPGARAQGPAGPAHRTRRDTRPLPHAERHDLADCSAGCHRSATPWTGKVALRDRRHGRQEIDKVLATRITPLRGAGTGRTRTDIRHSGYAGPSATARFGLARSARALTGSRGPGHCRCSTTTADARRRSRVLPPPRLPCAPAPSSPSSRTPG